MTTTFARRERDALGDLALAVGPDAPTLCGSWTVRDLVVHLLVRERRPWAAPGILVPALSGLVDHASTALAQRPFEELVETLRTPPAPVRIGTIERLVNSSTGGAVVGSSRSSFRVSTPDSSGMFQSRITRSKVYLRNSDRNFEGWVKLVQWKPAGSSTEATSALWL